MHLTHGYKLEIGSLIKKMKKKKKQQTQLMRVGGGTKIKVNSKW